jgi:hypothetical protein
MTATGVAGATRTQVLRYRVHVQQLDRDPSSGRSAIDANKPLEAAGIPATQALTAVAIEMRRIVAAPTGKGTVSTALTAAMPEPYLRWCRACRATHLFEMLFRLAAYLDAPTDNVEARWPADVRELDVDGSRRWPLAADLATLESAGTTDHDGPVRLLGPFDPFLQARDRELLVSDGTRRADLWRTLGRPGAVLAGTEIVGTWRPRASGRVLRIALDPWVPWPAPLRDAVSEQSARLSSHRGLTLTQGDR